MTYTGSLMNTLAGSARYVAPEVGMGATILCWTDRHAATIVEVVSPKTIRVQQDRATRTDARGMSDMQTWEYAPNPDAPIDTYTQRRNGAWVKQGQPMKGGQRIAVGHRDEHYDFSF